MRRRMNHVGAEVRSSLTELAAAASACHAASGRVRYVAVDVRAGERRDALLAALAPNLVAVSVLFPDPQRDPRRRMFSVSLAEAIYRALRPRGVVFVASDVPDELEHMVGALSAATDATWGGPCYERIGGDGAADAALDAAVHSLDCVDAGADGALSGPTAHAGGAVDARAPLRRNVWRAPTERECVCEQPDRHGEQRHVHRALFVRRAPLAVVAEGSATLAVSAALAAKPGASAGFYNARTRLARDLAVLEVRAALLAGPWAAPARQEGVVAAGSAPGGIFAGECEERAEESATSPRRADECGLGAEGCAVRLFDGFTSSGTLAIRVALEACAPAAHADASRRFVVVGSDVDPRCAALALSNARALNGLDAAPLSCLEAELRQDAPSSAEIAREIPAGCAAGVPVEGRASVHMSVGAVDARALCYTHPPCEWAHLDPFGSCVPHLDAFVARAPHGALISLVATDTAALYALYPDVARRAYAAELDRADPNWREAGVRALVGAVARAAARHGRGARPLHTTSAAHFVKLLVRVEKGAAAADRAVSSVRALTTPDGRTLGPLWSAALNDGPFLDRCATAAADALGTTGLAPAERSALRSAAAVFARSRADSPALPPFGRLAPAGLSPGRLVDALRDAGFSASRSAYGADAGRPGAGSHVRTDAPPDVWDAVTDGMRRH